MDNCNGWGLRKDVENSKGKFRQGSDPPVHFVGASLVCGSVPMEIITVCFVALAVVTCCG